MGEGPYSDISLAGSRETCLQPGRNKRKRRSEAARNAAQSETLRSRVICAFAYIPWRDIAQWNTRAASSRAPFSEWKAPLQRARSKRGPDGAAEQRHQYRLESSPEHGCNSEPHCHTYDEQHEHTPAQPHYCRPQMRRRGERNPESAAYGDIRGNAHGALRHQCERDGGQRKRCRAACPRFGSLLRAGTPRSRGRSGFPGRRSRTTTARANGMRHCVLRRHHALASLWQHAEAFGALSYWSWRFTHSTILPSGPRSLRPLGVRSRK
jgi:hypothetical protein